MNVPRLSFGPARYRSGVLGAAVVLGLAAWSLAPASDPPHWTGAGLNIDCTSQCHVPHHADGGTLTPSAGNVNLCQSCHVASGAAGDLPVDSADKAVRGVSGIHHAFDVPAVNLDLDTQRPLDSAMDLRVMDGNVVCSTCHDQHRAEQAFGGRPRVAPAKEIQVSPTTDGAVVSGGTFTGPAGVWYLIEITLAGDETTARFRYSKDNGISWAPTGCSSGNTAPCQQANGSTPVPLDDGFGVELTLATGSYEVDDRWELSASYPFLRATLGAGGSSMCGDCHRDWVMDHVAVEEWNSGSYKSHPVGVTLNANGKGYDRAVPLDGNGADQGSGAADANPTNDLELFASPSDLVECLTCHGVHYVDGNTQTVDGP